MKHLKTILGLVVLTGAISCAKNTVEDNGQVSFALNGNYEIADQTKSNVSQFTQLPASGDFTLTITDASDATFWTGKLSDWDVTTLIPAGSYTASATYGNLDEEGFDKPFFAGAADFAVAGDQSTPVSINVNLGNTVVLVSCTDNFKNYYYDYTFSLVRDGKTLVNFVKDETKAAFVDGYKLTLQGVISSAGKTQTFTKDYTGLDEATAYTIVFDAANVGGSAITISFNNTVETVELGDIELND